MSREWAPTEAGVTCDLPGAVLYGVLGPDLPDWCTPLDDPCWVTQAEASLMREEDPVLGLEAAGRMWAIPWWVMKNHHVANLTLEGGTFLVTLCEACVAGGVFDPMLGGRRARFHVVGSYKGSPLMTDDLGGSLWVMPRGLCVAGRSEGMALPMRPIVHARWREWAAMYPQALVVHGEGEPRDGHGAQCSGPDHDRMGGDVRPRDVEPTELVVTVQLGGSRRAYLLAAVHDQGGVVEDTLAGHPIVVVTRPGTWLCVVFVSAVEGTAVHLGWDRSQDPPTHLVDEATGWRFDLWGRCVTDGQSRAELPYVRSSLEKWRWWADFYPDTDLVAPGRAPATIS